MSKYLDRQWKKGLPKKNGVPMGIPTAAQAFWAKERAKAKRKKQKKAIAQTNARQPLLEPRKPSLVQVAGQALEAARRALDEHAENLRRIEEMVSPILDREGLSIDGHIPGNLTTKLLLADREMDARLVKHLFDAWAETSRLRARERKASGDYARAKSDEAKSGRAVHAVAGSPRPPWL